MTIADRLSTLRGAAAAIRSIEARLRALPAARLGQPVALREIREVMSLADRLELDAEAAGEHPPDEDSARWVDAHVSMSYGAEDRELVAALEARLARSPYRGGELPEADAAALRALGALRELIARYEAGEFMPPPSWFGIGERDV